MEQIGTLIVYCWFKVDKQMSQRKVMYRKYGLTQQSAKDHYTELCKQNDEMRLDGEFRINPISLD